MTESSAPISNVEPSFPRESVAVVIVDSEIGSFRVNDRKTRIVVDDSPPPVGFTFETGRADGTENHSDEVLETFINEFRILDKESELIIYAINPLLKSFEQDGILLKLQIVRDAIPTLKTAGVKVVLTAFGVADKAAGERLTSIFTNEGMTIFAAMPNNTADSSMYPALCDEVISVASDSMGGFVRVNKHIASNVNFISTGKFNNFDGSSYAAARVAAYGAFVSHHHKITKPACLRDALKQAATSEQVYIMGSAFQLSRLDAKTVAAWSGSRAGLATDA